MYQLNGEAVVNVGTLQPREKSSNWRRPFSQNTLIRVRMKSAWLRVTPSELIRTKTSATCSSSTDEASSTALKG